MNAQFRCHHPIFPPQAMSTFSSRCFSDSTGDHLDGEISFEEHIRNCLAHIFAGVRHPFYDENLNKTKVTTWVGRDALSAAVYLCMLLKDFKPPSELEEPLTKMIIDIKTTTLAALRGMNRSAAVLAIPLFYQLLVSVALEYGNQDLVREMIPNAPPCPELQLLLSPPREIYDKISWRFHTTLASQGRTDNGCEIYCDLIKAGWAKPRPYMQQWAALSSNISIGSLLVDTLVEYGIKIDELAVYEAVFSGEAAMLDYLLQIYKPLELVKRHELLKYAANRKPDGVGFFTVLFNHGIRDINWMPPPPLSPLNPRDRQELPRPFETPLHVAAETGDPAVVGWLIRHGAERLKNYDGFDQVEMARGYEREDNLLVFQRYSGWELRKEKRSSGCIVV